MKRGALHIAREPVKISSEFLWLIFLHFQKLASQSASSQGALSP